MKTAQISAGDNSSNNTQQKTGEKTKATLKHSRLFSLEQSPCSTKDTLAAACKVNTLLKTQAARASSWHLVQSSVTSSSDVLPGRPYGHLNLEEACTSKISVPKL